VFGARAQPGLRVVHEKPSTIHVMVNTQLSDAKYCWMHRLWTQSLVGHTCRQTCECAVLLRMHTDGPNTLGTM